MLENWNGFRQTEWQPVPRWALLAWLGFYAAFLLYVFHSHGGFLFIDMANLVVHEGGHMLFGWFGSTIGFWGGTFAMAGAVFVGRILFHAKANCIVRLLRILLL
jgi:hypothetical protein